MLRVFVCLVLLFAPLSLMAQEARRVALVIGNGNYEAVSPLTNPSNDATDIGSSLSRLGFEVTELHDAGARQLNIALRDFSRAADTSDMAIIYFAGHGMEIERRNYLIPVDAMLQRASDVAFEAVEMDKFLRAVSSAKTLRLVLLDACRDNPFLFQMADARTRSIGRGLGGFEPQAGVLVSYSAKGGTVALDGAGRNSPYAEALLANLEEPGLEIGQLFRRVRDAVLTATQGVQEPFTYGSLPASNIFLSDPEPTGPSDSEVLQAFLNADSEETEAGWEFFLNSYGESGADELVLQRARQKLAALRRRQEMAVPRTDAVPAVQLPQGSSPLLRACDQLAADPEDPDRPDGIAGVPIERIDALSAVTACTLAVSGHPDSGRSFYQLSRAQMAANSDERSRDALLRAADMGYPAAAATIGEKMLSGPGDPEVVKRAVNILEDAMATGSGTAALHLGNFFSKNALRYSGFERKRPIDYYRVAAASGIAEAQYEAGYRLISMYSATDEERRQGLEWLEASAAAGNEDAYKRLTYFYLSHNTDPQFQNTARALELIEAQYNRGDVEAAERLARIHRLGLGVEASAFLAAMWTTRAAESGSAKSMAQLGYYLETGWGIGRNPDKAAASYFDALAAGSTLPYYREGREWPREVARALQRRLSQSSKARYRGPIDGLVGPGTRRAMRRLCGCTDDLFPIQFDRLFR